MTKKWTSDTVKLNPENRVINQRQVERLMDSIKKHGFIESIPILVDPKGYVIDGQHRLEACKRLSIEPRIVEEDIKDILPVINSTQLKWRAVDYIHYYAERGIEDYIILQNICKEKDISPKIAEAIITGKSVYRDSMNRTKRIQPIQLGTFKIPDKSVKGLAKLSRKIDAILQLVSALRLARTERLVLAIIRLAEDKNFVFSKMISKIEFQRAKIYRCTTIDEYKTMLATIYNYKNTKKVAV